MCGRATLAMDESSTSMKVARVTVMATIQGLMLGRHGFSTTGCGSWAGASGSCALGSSSVVVAMRYFIRLWRLEVGFRVFAGRRQFLERLKSHFSGVIGS